MNENEPMSELAYLARYSYYREMKSVPMAHELTGMVFKLMRRMCCGTSTGEQRSKSRQLKEIFNVCLSVVIRTTRYLGTLYI